MRMWATGIRKGMGTGMGPGKPDTDPGLQHVIWQAFNAYIYDCRHCAHARLGLGVALCSLLPVWQWGVGLAQAVWLGILHELPQKKIQRCLFQSLHRCVCGRACVRVIRVLTNGGFGKSLGLLIDPHTQPEKHTHPVTPSRPLRGCYPSRSGSHGDDRHSRARPRGAPARAQFDFSVGNANVGGAHWDQKDQYAAERTFNGPGRVFSRK